MELLRDKILKIIENHPDIIKGDEEFFYIVKPKVYERLTIRKLFYFLHK